METYSSLITKQKSFFKTEKTKNIAFRLEALQKLRNAIKNNEKTLMEALRTDLNKSEFDAYTSEIGFILEELRFTIKHLRS
ncbi:acyl-CoA reductase-like NAD-dependent aldehyde dehydrogenase [Neobacillus cucumis]|nr:acyl-CoA reductase-like NAD-dependent aldehyde dehydrogenase [Neobacillus cucumis]